MAVTPLTRLRRLCLSFPEVDEVEAWSEPTFRVRDKMFATFANAKNHHGRGRNAVWVKSSPGRQVRLVMAAPHQFFVPPYMGDDGWIGVWLDRGCNWTELTDILRGAYCTVAPKALARAVLYGAPVSRRGEQSTQT